MVFPIDISCTSIIRTPDKANKFLPSVVVRIDEVLLYMIQCRYHVWDEV